MRMQEKMATSAIKTFDHIKYRRSLWSSSTTAMARNPNENA
jgi:hypothetical protein